MRLRSRTTRLLPICLGMALVSGTPAIFAQEGKAVGVEKKLAQKIQTVDHILNSQDLLDRINGSNDEVAKRLLARAAENFLRGEEYFERAQYLEAEAVIDYVLRDLSASSQLVNVLQQSKHKYAQFIEQLDAFVLPEWSELSFEEGDYLQDRLQQVSDLRSRAIRLASANRYEDAIALLEQGYSIKAELLERLRHDTTVVYDLQFSTVQDEYRYLLSRTYHFLELVHLAMSQRQVDAQTQKLADDHLYRSMLTLEQAEHHETEGNFSDALPALEESITQLASALKILGIEI